MLIWRGWGWMVPFGTFLILVILQLLVEGLGGNYSDSNVWPGIGLVVGGLGNFLVGRNLNSRPGRTLVDEATNERVELKPKNDFFFLRMEWWGMAIALGGVAFLIVRAVS